MKALKRKDKDFRHFNRRDGEAQSSLTAFGNTKALRHGGTVNTVIFLHLSSLCLDALVSLWFKTCVF